MERMFGLVLRQWVVLAAIIGVGLLGLPGFAGMALAGPLNRQWVDRDADWVFHLNMEALAASDLGPLLSIEVLEKNDDQVFVFLRAAGVDPLRDLKGLTVYGWHSTRAAAPGPGGEDEGVAVIIASAAIERLAEHLVAQLPGFERIADAPVPQYTWLEHGSRRYGQIMPGPEGLRLALVARDQARLAAAAAIIAGAAPSLAAVREGPLAQEPTPGAFMFAMAQIQATEGDGQRRRAALTRMTESIRFEMGSAAIEGAEPAPGEDGSEYYIMVALRVRQGRDAANVVQIINGLMAMARLAAASDPDLNELASALDGLQITTGGDGREIVARLGVPAGQMRNLVDDAKRVEKSWKEEERK
jgi:hypothetical protein